MDNTSAIRGAPETEPQEMLPVKSTRRCVSKNGQLTFCDFQSAPSLLKLHASKIAVKETVRLDEK